MKTRQDVREMLVSKYGMDPNLSDGQVSAYIDTLREGIQQERAEFEKERAEFEKELATLKETWGGRIAWGITKGIVEVVGIVYSIKRAIRRIV